MVTKYLQIDHNLFGNLFNNDGIIKKQKDDGLEGSPIGVLLSVA
jgi:hypothetical protein